MQFNHPEVLYALFLLIIPVIVHLFQLRKFRKERFTNVKFLKRLTRQTRKSSRLKKWLVLATRLLLLACIIFAFSRPYFPSEDVNDKDFHTYIYLDNSYSMQASGKNGRLLNRSIQQLLEHLPEDREITLITNNEEFAQVTKRDLQQIDFTALKTDLRTVFLKAENNFPSVPGANKILLISDFAENFEVPQNLIKSGTTIYALPTVPESEANVSLDSVYSTATAGGSNRVHVQVSYTGINPGNVPVSLYDAERLLGKSSIDLSSNAPHVLEFTIEDEIVENGRVEIDDTGYQFDNSLYFTINKSHPINIISINGTNSGFLSRIFSAPRFTFSSMAVNSIEYNTLAAAQVVILNEVEEIPVSLASILNDKNKENSIFIIIPPKNGISGSLQAFIRETGFAELGEKKEQERLITNISFEHPLFVDVFEGKISNFEYPVTQVSYNISSSSPSLLSYEDNWPFLIESHGNFLFTAPLTKDNSNFQQSPLIVPTFYNMGISALQPAQLYYLLGEINSIEIPIDLDRDEILHIRSQNTNFIPQQQKFSNKVEIVTEELPEFPGNFTIFNEKEPVSGISYNVNRNENSVVNQETPAPENVIILSSLKEFFSSSGFQNEINSLWKWFIIFALLFLIIETLLLKYIK